MQYHPRMIGVYIHIPYCRVICPYCDFVRARRSRAVPSAFVEALCSEIGTFEGPSKIRSVFVGGGTPSMIAPKDWARIVGAVRERFEFGEVEFTVEANPDDVSLDSIEAWKSSGVNRVSLGVQSFDDGVLRHLGRCHDSAVARRACGLVADRFENWGMDLIFGGRPNGWPDDRVRESFAADLRACLESEPPHVSAYSLTIERGTPFALAPGVSVPGDASLDLYRMAHKALGAYRHYEVSNFAKPEFESEHNLIYWRNAEYAGFGPGAVSFLDGVRSRNSRSISGYIRAPGLKSEVLNLSGDEVKVETLIQHFRTRAGIGEVYYRERFGAELMGDFGEVIESLVARGLLAVGGGAVRPTWKGFELNDEIGLALVSPESPGA